MPARGEEDEPKACGCAVARGRLPAGAARCALRRMLEDGIVRHGVSAWTGDVRRAAWRRTVRAKALTIELQPFVLDTSVLLADPGSTGSVSGRGSTTDGTRYV